VFLCLAGDGGPHRRQGREERRLSFQIAPVLWMFLWRHVNPRATNGGGTWRRRATTVPAVSEGLLCNSWIFRDLFCIFTCWNMYLNYYYFLKKIMLCCKHATMRKLVKSGVCLCCYPFFGSHTKNKKNTYQKIDIQKESKKIIRVRK